MPEEYQTLAKFADAIERRLQAAREESRKARIAELNAVRATLPQAAFKMPVTELDLPDNVIEALEPMYNVGEIMMRFLIDEDRVRSVLSGLPKDAFTQVQAALDKLVWSEDELLAPVEAAEETAEPVEEAAAPEAAAPAGAAEAEEEEPIILEPFVDEDTVTPVRKVERAPVAVYETDEEGDYDEDDDDDDDFGGGKKGKKKKKKERQQRRQLVFDEELGKTIIKRKRKGGRSRDEWDY